MEERRRYGTLDAVKPTRGSIGDRAPLTLISPEAEREDTGATPLVSLCAWIGSEAGRGVRGGA